MFFDESAQGVVTEPASLGLFRSAESDVAPARDVGVPSARLVTRASEINNSRFKRALDVVGAATLLLVLLPVLLIIALAIRLESTGPVFFRQKRYGVAREIFTLYKFRSMSVLETHGTFVQVSAGDSRITKVGAFLRRTSLDELPQLLNVLRGDMSLVGPRPHAVPMDDTFGRILPNYSDRHLVRPGLTGLAQIEGHRGPTDAMNKIQMRLRCDRAYIRKWTPLYDVKILLLTPASLLHANAF
ncbi:Sugar transferase involved in LPS biosynthesis (colanic, teichoic acid) [Kaistia soli DSM 19436]|uniref:Sugar transferase involved in LPS biosynthesis (Colanic, teichoic acid) n=1 Tax=Kaistia soli DSM 19436 TaxID=1122133 RepID=A0A1M5FUZ2_9HYPH|nr:Sugar transferase involved in LPS biosynthesis (colanic, teichoic acid) [Kaistia soli DSM 19436]